MRMVRPTSIHKLQNHGGLQFVRQSDESLEELVGELMGLIRRCLRPKRAPIEDSWRSVSGLLGPLRAEGLEGRESSYP